MSFALGFLTAVVVLASIVLLRFRRWRRFGRRGAWLPSRRQLARLHASSPRNALRMTLNDSWEMGAARKWESPRKEGGSGGAGQTPGRDPVRDDAGWDGPRAHRRINRRPGGLRLQPHHHRSAASAAGEGRQWFLQVLLGELRRELGALASRWRGILVSTSLLSAAPLAGRAAELKATAPLGSEWGRIFGSPRGESSHGIRGSTTHPLLAQPYTSHRSRRSTGCHDGAHRPRHR
jgi:hypothetical protein